MLGEIYLGFSGAESLLTGFDRKFKIVNNQIGREDRTVNGTFVMDIIAVKKRFILDYGTIDELELLYFQQLYNSYSELSLIVYTSDTLFDSYTVIMRAFDKSRLLSVGGGVWEGVTIELEEV